MQLADKDILPVYNAFKIDPINKPEFNEYSGESPTTKAYFVEWERLELLGGVLYRRWESADGMRSHL